MHIFSTCTQGGVCITTLLLNLRLQGYVRQKLVFPLKTKYRNILSPLPHTFSSLFHWFHDLAIIQYQVYLSLYMNKKQGWEGNVSGA
jgi:hypothetical protein